MFLRKYEIFHSQPHLTIPYASLWCLKSKITLVSRLLIGVLVCIGRCYTVKYIWVLPVRQAPPSFTQPPVFVLTGASLGLRWGSTCVLCWRGGFLQHVNCWGVGTSGGREKWHFTAEICLYWTGEWEERDENLDGSLSQRFRISLNLLLSWDNSD